MSKISEVPLFNSAAYAAVTAGPKKTRPPVKKTAFSAVLETAEEAEGAPVEAPLPVSEETLRELLDAVHSRGDDIKQRPFPEEIKQYKKAVRDFLHYVLENGYTVGERISGAGVLKRKKLTLIQVIDRKLEELAAFTISSQRDQLALLARVDEITGLLVNLLQ
ncbi:MAG: YaaR family protein [Spirochaetaceae bacterium]|jgi:uncharacterized protein YaaR (DUF327 family)|nr:YaaR family protein [Spirochaetaceae bacterium]